MYNCTYVLDNILSPQQYALIVAILFCVFLLFFFKKIHTSWLSALGIVMIAFGGGYNLFERMTTGCVLDNIDIIFFRVNGADLSISVGLLLICTSYILHICPKNKKHFY